MQPEAFRQQIAAGRGDVDADLVLKNARVINVFTNEIEEADVAMQDIMRGGIRNDDPRIPRNISE